LIVNRGSPSKFHDDPDILGTRAPRGSVSKLHLVLPRLGLASPAVPNEIPRHRVPNFVGRRISVVVDWAQRLELDWEAKLPPLSAGGASGLLDNYIVVRQHPAPGKDLALGVGYAGPDDGWRPTPLVVSGIQR